jgi:hypothetical protein
VYSICKISEIDPFIASGGKDKSIKFWNWAEGTCSFEQIMNGNDEGDIWSIIKLKEENFFASASSSK